MEYRKFIENQLKTASDIARSYFGHVTGEIKVSDPGQVVTEADRKIGQAVIESIQKEYPDHNIIDEEAGVIDKKSQFTWVIDPIDGTSNYALSLPMYGCMVGLLQNNAPIAGGIALPYFNEIYTAEKGEGTIGPKGRLHVSEETDLQKVLLSYGTDKDKSDESKDREVLILRNIIQNIRNMRSSNSVFDTIQVSNGNYGGFVNWSSKIWDNVGQHVIVEEAGGVYTDLFGKAMDYSDPVNRAEQNFTFCAAPQALHDTLQKLIRGEYR